MTGGSIAAPAAAACRERYAALVGEWPGWFHHTDRRLFETAAAVQADANLTGDLLEIGVYLGKSAALLGCLVRDGERLVVCDVFDAVVPDEGENARELPEHYGDLTQREFERRYLAVHAELPTVIAALSTTLPERDLGRRFRFVHVDGGHTYQAVREDVRTVRDLLLPGGIVAFDDWRSAHVPGVHAAVWGAVHEDGLIPLVVSDAKLYATFGPLQPAALAFRDAVSDSAEFPTDLHDTAGHLLVRITACHVDAP